MSLAHIKIEPDILKASIDELTSAKELARGGFKIVYEAYFSQKREALKLIYLPKLTDPDSQEAFNNESLGRVAREITLLRNCKRPEIVKLGNYEPKRIKISDEEFIVYSEEFIEGCNLDQTIKKSKDSPPDASSLKCLLVSLLEAIHELWNMKVVHRDVKPLNVMKTDVPSRPFVLLDLGIAFSVAEIHLTAFPEQREPPGTWKYMAPEMLKPNFRDNVNFRSDLYTIGQTVFEYATGAHPLSRGSDDKFQTISRILHQESKRLECERPDLPMQFSQLINQMMKKNPALRPGNIDKLIKEVEGI